MLRPAAVCRQHSPAELPHNFAPQWHVVGLPLMYTVHCSAYAGDPANEAAPATTPTAIQMAFFIKSHPVHRKCPWCYVPVPNQLGNRASAFGRVAQFIAKHPLAG